MRSRHPRPILALILVAAGLTACPASGPPTTGMATATPQGHASEPDKSLVQVKAVITKIAATEKALTDDAAALLALAAANPPVTTPVPRPSPSGYSSTPVTATRVVAHPDGTRTLTVDAVVEAGLYGSDETQSLTYTPGSPVKPGRFFAKRVFMGEGMGSSDLLTKEWLGGDRYFQSMSLAWDAGTNPGNREPYAVDETGHFTAPHIGRTTGAVTVSSGTKETLTLARTLTADGGTFEIGFPDLKTTVSGSYDAAGTPLRTVTVRGPAGTSATRQLP